MNANLCAVVACAFALPAAAVDVVLGPPPGNPDSGSFFDIDVTLVAGSDVIGSYAFDLIYDPAVIVIDAIDGGDTPAFSSAPVAPTASFASGLTRFAAVQASAVAPSGDVSIARLRFQAVGASGAASDIGVVVAQLHDGNVLPLPSTVFATAVQLSFVDQNDSDGDGLSDIEEANAGTDINDSDTDDDLLNDAFEVGGGLDPLDDGSSDPQQGASGDPDGDGLDNLQEQSLGTNPTNADSDGDGLADGDEVANGTDALVPDSDGDGLTDGFEVANGLDPNDDGSTDVDSGALGDPDGDGVSNLDEQMLGSDPNSPDTDGDGLTDLYEFQHSLDPLDDGSGEVENGPAGDPDLDGFTNLQEFGQDADPRDDHSQPVDLNVDHPAGAQFVFRPLQPAPGFTTFDYLAELNAGGDVVSGLELIGANNVLFRANWIAGAPGGDNVALTDGQGVLLRFNGASAMTFAGKVDCVGIDLNAGINVYGMHCVPVGETAFRTLLRFGPGIATTLQRLDPLTGLYQTAYFSAAGPAGDDFPIRRGEAYVLSLLLPVNDFDPLR